MLKPWSTDLAGKMLASKVAQSPANHPPALVKIKAHCGLRLGFGKRCAHAPPEYRFEQVAIWTLLFCLDILEAASSPLLACLTAGPISIQMID
jgi:hypothetical protein